MNGVGHIWPESSFVDLGKRHFEANCNRRPLSNAKKSQASHIYSVRQRVMRFESMLNLISLQKR